MKKLVCLLLIAVLCSVTAYAASDGAPFAGAGKKNDPFILSTAEDLVAFAEQVNSGNHFEGQYFQQRADIDLAGIDWIPIGEYGTANSFDGVYDGNGHCIKNLTINNRGNCGLFGQLGGTVMNLGIESGEISGDCVGGICSHAAKSTAKIINCYNKANLRGQRAGGIADNFNGMIISCWSACNLTGGSIGKIVSLGATSMKFCYREVPTAEEMNRDLLIVANSAGISSNDLNMWTQTENGPAFSPKKMGLSLIGAGTKDDPFILSSAEDLVVFAQEVNSGNHFEGQYFQQSADIDLAGIDWIPIGEFGTANSFDGVYDGNGHCVKNLTINNRGNCGFFGQLGGTVMNLGIESGNISGGCVGGISSHAASVNALIINCYNKASIQGARAGGIADNFNGNIVGCWSDCDLSGDSTGRIVSFTAIVMDYCYEDTTPTADELNKNQFSASYNAGISFKDLNMWTQTENGPVFSAKKRTLFFRDIPSIFFPDILYIIVVVPVLLAIPALGIALIILAILACRKRVRRKIEA